MYSYRKILRAASYTPVETLRGDVGSSLMISRLMKGKLTYFKGISSRNNELLKEIIRNDKCKLTKEVNMILQEIKLSEFLNSSIEKIKLKCNEWDEEIWITEIGKKNSLDLYKNFKVKIKQETYYNEEKSLIIFRMRTNTLNLNDRKRFQNESTECQLCKNEIENLEHFLLHCPALEDQRKEILALQRPRIQEDRDLLRDLLFESHPEKEKLHNLWIQRKKILKDI